jgi:hypothetical protein
VLNINGNQLDSLEDLMCLDVLDTLYASRNNLKDLDHVSIALRTLRQLRVVDLRDNSIIKSPNYKERIVGYLGGIGTQRKIYFTDFEQIAGNVI